MKKNLSNFLKCIITGLTILLNFNAPLISSALDDVDSSTGTTNPAPDPDESEEYYDFNSDLIFRAVSPGYTEETPSGKSSNVGEFIELLNLTDAPLALAGYSIVYTGSGAPATVFTFPEDSFLVGKHLLLRYDNPKDPDVSQSDLTYRIGSSGMIQSKGLLELLHEGETDPVDSVCWGNIGNDCAKAFSSTTKGALVRDLELGDFGPSPILHTIDFEIDPENLILPIEEEPDPEEPEVIPPQCRGLEITELLTYYTTSQSEQFIEFFNPTAEPIDMDGCKISYKNKKYDLSGSVPSGGYYAYYPNSQFSLTKNPTNPLVLAVIDTDGEAVDEISYPNGQKKSTSFAKIFDSDGGESWQITYATTPGSENVYQKFRSCEEGKIINEATGNCVKATTLKDATAAVLKSSTSAALAPCPEGKYRNPLTNRCKSIETASTSLKECAEGYERNPETNRCRKITSASTNNGADYAITPTEHSNQTVFVGIGIVLIIISLGGIYIVLQFRHEIARACRKIGQRLNRIREDLLSRTIGRHRD